MHGLSQLTNMKINFTKGQFEYLKRADDSLSLLIEKYGYLYLEIDNDPFASLIN